MRVAERVIQSRIRAPVNINQTQFGFVPGKSTFDTIFIVRQLQEEHLAKNKNLYFAFDLEKAFDRIPRKVLWWSLRRADVPEFLVKAVIVLYAGSHMVGAHQVSVISPLLFDIVMDEVTSSIREGLPWELLYADDLVLFATSKQDLLRKLDNWMRCLSCLGLKINPQRPR